MFNVLQTGELTRKGLSAGLVSSHPEIPGHQMCGLRTRIVLGYAGIALNIAYDTITCDFPPLLERAAGHRADTVTRPDLV